MSKENQLRKEIEECRSKLRDNSKAIDPSTRQTLLDTIRADRAELDAIDSENRASTRKIIAVEAPTGRTVIAKVNSNSRRIIGSADNIIRVGVR